MRRTAGVVLEAEIVTVYRTADGAIHHARCGERITLGGPLAGGLEVAFYCRECTETVTLPYCVFPRIPTINGHVTSCSAVRARGAAAL